MPGLLRRIGRAASSVGNMAQLATNPAGYIGGQLGGKVGVGGLVDFAKDPAGTIKSGYEWASGAQATDRALEQQMAAAQQAGGAIQGAYNQGQGLLAPYQQGGAQDYGAYRGMVQGGAFTPQYQQYGGPMSSGGQFTPQFQGYQGPMTSGNQLPQYQQFQGQAQFNAAARPERQAATSENVNMYMDPGYQFRLNQGLNAVQSSAAAKGLLGSSGTLNQIQDYAQGLASQEFGNAYGRFMNNQNLQQGDFESDRGFGMQNFNQNFQNAYRVNQDANAWSAQNADRGQAWFNQDRAAGMQQNQFQNNWNLNQANFQQGAFEGDRAAAMQANQFANNFNMQNAQNSQNAWQGLVNTGYGAAGQGANMATDFGMNMANLYGAQGNANAAATMARYNQNRGLFSDLVNLGTRAYGAG